MVVSWDMSEPAANWDGKYGFTDGKCKLGTSPLKDVTFPGTLGADPELDKELVKFSWTSFLRCTGQMDSWVDRSYPPCTHQKWAEYLRWALKESKADHRKGIIEKVEPKDGKVAVYIKGNTKPEIFDGFVFTGPGKCIPLPIVNNRRNDRLLDAKTFWEEKNRIKGKICLIGTGESCAAILESFVDSKPDADISVVTMFGYLPMRDEGYSANSMFTNPTGWEELPVEVRKTIINRADRGVLSPRCHSEVAASQLQLREIYGQVLQAQCMRNGVELKIKAAQAVVVQKFDYVIASIGFDILPSLKQLLSSSRFPNPDSSIIEKIDYTLCLPQFKCNIHVPGLAGIAQGPGFPNLSCLSLAASRIFAAYESS